MPYLMTGDNGVGKSTLANCMLLVSSIDGQVTPRVHPPVSMPSLLVAAGSCDCFDAYVAVICGKLRTLAGR